MSVHRTWLLGVALTVGTFGAVPAYGQEYFGKNQVEYRHFDWQVIETEHFLVHYYPDERVAALDAARMAERAYARLSRILHHDFREKKPIMVFASRADFGQNNVTGDLGEGTGGVTEPGRDRMLLPFTGDYRSFEHVLTHEMVHEFQFDIFQRGHGPGSALQSLSQVNPPLWFMEGMAEYLSIGPDDPHTATVIRDAALNGNLPTMTQMTRRPDLYFPYRYGEAFWAYVAQRWGDDVVGSVLSDVPAMGIERAFKLETGQSLDDLGDQWREAMQVQHLPQIASLERPRHFAKPLLSTRRTGGEIFLAPSLSPDGKYVAFLSTGSFLRGQVFIDLWLADARTGKRITRLVKSTFDPNVQELQILYSQSAFSPDGRLLAFTALGQGKELLYILDVARRKRIARIELPLDGITSPSWSPDGHRLVFSGDHGGITDLYTVNADGSDLRQLTSDKYADLQPQWSPDGSTLAFATDRGSPANLATLRFPKLRIALYDMATGHIELLPNQAGLNINPVWAPDSRSLAYVSNRSGIENLFLYDLNSSQQYQLTHVVGGVTAITEVSPAISWARDADRLAFTYYENGDYSVWTVDNPRTLAREPYRDGPPAAAIAARGMPADSATVASLAEGETPTGARAGSSYYLGDTGVRASGQLPGAAKPLAPPARMTVAALLDSGALVLPDTTRFKRYSYHTRFSPDYVAQPTVGYTPNSFGGGVYGGTAIVLSDMVGNDQLAFALGLNGRISEAQLFAAYTNLSRRFQYTTGVMQQPEFFGNGYSLDPTQTGYRETTIITRYLVRQAFAMSVYPFDRFTRAEIGLRATSLDRADLVFSRTFDATQSNPSDYTETEANGRTVNFIQPVLAYVSDNVLWGATAPIYGRRYRFQVQPAFGNYKWTELLGDYRRYDPILFNYLTLATRATVYSSVGRDADTLRKYLGYTALIRGYDINTFQATDQNCPLTGAQRLYRCSPVLGSSLAFANAELRFPLVRGGTIAGVVPIPAVEGAFFFDAGTAWFSGQRVELHRASVADPAYVRSLLTSHGFSLRINLFNYVILRWDYAIPMDAPRHRGVWQFSLYPPF